MRKLIFLSLIIMAALSHGQSNSFKEKKHLAKLNENLTRENASIQQVQGAEFFKTARSEIAYQGRFKFKTFYNSVRGFKIDYPSFLTMGRPPENGDGRDFTSDGGEVKLLAYSSYMLDQSVSQLFYQELRDKDLAITYKVNKPDWYILSGINNKTGRLFYKKTYYSNLDGGQIRTMYLEYPPNRQKDFDVIIPRLLQSFKDI